MVSTAVGGTTLVTNTYYDNNGLLKKSDYGNGYDELYVYDDLNRLSIEKQGNKVVRYYYDNNGNLATLDDRLSGIKHNYEYDFVGRLVRSFATKDSANYLTTQIKYDDYNRVSQQKFILADGTKQNYSYNYTKDNLLGSATLPNSKYLSYTYDALNRPVLKVISGPNATAYTENYSYLSTGSATTSLVSQIIYSGGDKLSYGYDDLNNITSVTNENGTKITYEYDGLGQLIRENNQYVNKTYMYNYDKGGNITAVRTYSYTTGEISGAPNGIATYTYGDSTWKDKLTSYNGTAITYDSIGNPLNYRNGTLTWNGRRLASYTSSSGTATNYTYNSDGVRVGKSGSRNVSYVVSGTQILSETNGTTTT